MASTKKTMTRAALIKYLVEYGEYSPAMAAVAISHYIQERMSEGATPDQAWEMTVEFMTLSIGGV